MRHDNVKIFCLNFGCFNTFTEVRGKNTLSEKKCGMSASLKENLLENNFPAFFHTIHWYLSQQKYSIE